MQHTREAFDKLVGENYNAIFGTALKFTKNPADAEDLFQEACIRAWRSFPKFEFGTSFLAWLQTIQYRLFVNSYRKSKRHAQGLEDYKGESYWAQRPNVFLNPEQALSWKEGYSDEVKEAAEKTNFVFFETVRLFSEGYHYHEIAEETGVSIGTVMSRIYRGRKAMQTHLNEQSSANFLER
jgi:RNA polymerase sigma-70 factor, ECF subfamily